MKFLKYIDEIFYGMYIYLAKSEGGSAEKATLGQALSTLVSLVSIEIFIFATIVVVFGDKFRFLESRGEAAMLFVSLILANWLVFIFRGRYQKIFEEYHYGDSSLRKRASKSTLIFCLSAVLMFLISLGAVILF